MFDIEPIVYIPENPSYPLLDEKLLSDVSDKTIIMKKVLVLATAAFLFTGVAFAGGDGKKCAK